MKGWIVSVKKYSEAIKICLAILLSVTGVLLLDRHIHITQIDEHQQKEYLSIKPVWFTHSQKGDWLNFEEFDMKLSEMFLVVDDYNSLTKTWDCEYAYAGYWTYLGEYGEPYILAVQQTSEEFPVELIHTPVEMATENIDGVSVSYYRPESASENRNIVIEIKDEQKSVKVMFLYENLTQVMPVLEKIWSNFKG